jgi:AraC family ethanolamine operon transcriptional activator
VVQPRRDNYNFGILEGPSSVIYMGQRHLNSKSIICFREDDCFEAVGELCFTGCTLSFAKARVTELAQNLGYANFDDYQDIWGTDVAPSLEQLKTVRASMRQIFNLANDPGLTPDGMLGLKILLDQELPMLVLKSLEGAKVRRRISLPNRVRALKRAVDFIHAHPREALTVEDLCRESASSLSTLERAFLERYAVSPKRFMLLQRLHHVRLILLQQTDSRKISNIANEYGFWHMSSFAADYKKVFGQLPSQTLNSPRLFSPA